MKFNFIRAFCALLKKVIHYFSFLSLLISLSAAAQNQEINLPGGSMTVQRIFQE